jgi:PKD domain-containing protein
VKSLALRVTLLVLASAAAVFPSAAQARHPLAGLLKDLGGRATRAERARIASSGVLPYGGGPVLHHNRTHLIFWQPAGSGLTFEPGYRALIEGFMHNVAAASRSTSNVYSLTGQYRDRNGPAAYASTYGGALTATDPLPANGCAEPSSTGPGWTVCLTDEQLQREIERVVHRNHLPTRATDLYFLVTPNGLGDCEFAGSTTCALGGDVNGYCGYHSVTDDGLVLYAVIPFNAVPGHCQSENPRPNGSTADPVISTISHEQSEMITDPLGNAWVDPNTGNENGDLCLINFGAAIGGSGSSAWNEDINGGHYFLQEEWSNHSGACEARAQADSVSFRAALRSSHPFWVSFSPQAADPQGKIVAYRWFFSGGRSWSGRRAQHRYWHPGNYRVVLRTTDSWGNWAYYAATLAISRVGGRAVLATNPG